MRTLRPMLIVLFLIATPTVMAQPYDVHPGEDPPWHEGPHCDVVDSGFERAGLAVATVAPSVSLYEGDQGYSWKIERCDYDHAREYVVTKDHVFFTSDGFTMYDHGPGQEVHRFPGDSSGIARLDARLWPNYVTLGTAYKNGQFVGVMSTHSAAGIDGEIRFDGCFGPQLHEFCIDATAVGTHYFG